MPAALVRRARGRLLPALAALVAGVALAGCTAADESSTPSPAAASTPTDEGTPLEDLDTTSLVVRRASFCEAVDPAAVARALGVDVADVPAVAAYGNGQRTQLTPQVKDVAHEFGCSWTAGGVVARAWVFAPPITPQRAAALASGPRRVQGCSPTRGAAVYPAYGKPSVGLTCRVDGAVELSWRGLFGDAWLTCTLTVPGGRGDSAFGRADTWCSAIATAATPIRQRSAAGDHPLDR